MSAWFIQEIISNTHVNTKDTKPECSPKYNPCDTSKRSFTFRLEIPNNSDNILRINNVAYNKQQEDAVEQNIGALIRHHCYHFKISNENYTNPS